MYQKSFFKLLENVTFRSDEKLFIAISGAIELEYIDPILLQTKDNVGGTKLTDSEETDDDIFDCVSSDLSGSYSDFDDEIDSEDDDFASYFIVKVKNQKEIMEQFPEVGKRFYRKLMRKYLLTPPQINVPSPICCQKT